MVAVTKFLARSNLEFVWKRILCRHQMAAHMLSVLGKHAEVSAGLRQLFTRFLCYSIPELWVGPS